MYINYINYTGLYYIYMCVCVSTYVRTDLCGSTYIRMYVMIMLRYDYVYVNPIHSCEFHCASLCWEFVSPWRT